MYVGVVVVTIVCRVRKQAVKIMDRVDVGGGLDTKYFKPPETRQTLVK